MGGPGSGRRPGGGKVKAPDILKYYRASKGSAVDKRIKRGIKLQKLGEKRLWGHLDRK